MKIKERIKQYIENKGISKYQFYQETGVSNGFLDKDGSVGSDKCEKISYVYPDLNIEWLITGNGEMLNREDQEFEFCNKKRLSIEKNMLEMIKELSSENALLKKEIEYLKRKIVC